MRYTKMSFHHFPGHDHSHCHEHHEEPKRTKEETIELIEALCLRNEETRKELMELREEIEEQAVAGYLAESGLFIGKANAKLDSAMAAIKRSS